MSKRWWAEGRKSLVFGPHESTREELALANMMTFKKEKSPSVFTTTGLFFSEARHHDEIKEQLYGIMIGAGMKP